MMKVFVYFNLHQRVWSIKSMEGLHRGRVIAHATSVILRDCTFKVSEAGRQRVLREGRKNVHAGVVGQLDSWRGMYTKATPLWMTESWTAQDTKYLMYGRRAGLQVTYNPRKYDSFVVLPREEGEFVPYAIDKAEMVVFGNGAFAFDPCDMPVTQTVED